MLSKATRYEIALAYEQSHNFTSNLNKKERYRFSTLGPYALNNCDHDVECLPTERCLLAQWTNNGQGTSSSYSPYVKSSTTQK